MHLDLTVGAAGLAARGTGLRKIVFKIDCGGWCRSC